jgi:hypothetical protein
LAVLRAWLSLNNLQNHKPRGPEEARHLIGTEEDEVDRDVLSPPLVHVHDIIADVERQEQRAARSQDALHLAQDYDDVWPRDVDDRVKGGDAASRPVLGVQRSQVPLPEFDR